MFIYNRIATMVLLCVGIVPLPGCQYNIVTQVSEKGVHGVLSIPNMI